MRAYLHNIRFMDRYVSVLASRLRMAGIEFGRTSGAWGFDIHGVVNLRTGSEWHSPIEAVAVIREKVGIQQFEAHQQAIESTDSADDDL